MEYLGIVHTYVASPLEQNLFMPRSEGMNFQKVMTLRNALCTYRHT